MSDKKTYDEADLITRSKIKNEYIEYLDAENEISKAFIGPKKSFSI